MATAYKVVYKNHCTPQEEVDFSTGSRWYLDSDCGRKMTGTGDITVNGPKLYVNNLVVTEAITIIAALFTDFVFIKNTGGNSGDDVLVSIDGSIYYIILSAGESFASNITTGAVVRVKCATSEDSTVEYFVAT
jgi:hypothetical protein